MLSESNALSHKTPRQMPDTVIPTSLTRNRLALTQYSSPHRRPSSSYNGPKLGVRTRRPPSIPVSKPPPIKQCHCQDLTLRKPDTALKLVVADGTRWAPRRFTAN